jgi:hypothetical protein
MSAHFVIPQTERRPLTCQFEVSRLVNEQILGLEITM